MTVKTGDAASIRLAANGTTGARVDMTPGEVSAWLPQGTRLGGWKTGERTPRALIVSLHFTYPTGADHQTTVAAEAAAEKKVTRLAEALAVALAR